MHQDSQGNVRDDTVCQAHYEGPPDPNCEDCERDRIEIEAINAEILAGIEEDERRMRLLAEQPAVADDDVIPF